MAKTKGKSQKGRGAPTKAKPTQAAKLTKVARPAKTAKPAKPPKSTRTTALVPVAPLAPLAPAVRDELAAPRDIARLLRYGESFGLSKIDVRMLPLQLPVSSGALALFDPGAPKTWRAFERPVAAGQFRVMLSVARAATGVERLAAVVIHVGRPPIARWTVAHYQGGKKPRSPDELPCTAVSTGWLALIDAGEGSPGVLAVPPVGGIEPVEVPLTDGRRALALPCGNGDFAAYWAVDAADKPVCLVVDFDVFTQKEWKVRAT